jgi:hypothetical protein
MPRKPVGHKTLTKRLIEQVLDKLGVRHSRDRDGDLIITLIPGDNGGGDLLCWFLVEADFFHLVCTLGPKIPQCQWPTAIAVCNAYHRYSLLGRAVLHIREGQDVATLRFEAAIDCSDGVSASFLQTFISSHLSCACFFRDMASRQKVWAANKTICEDPVIICNHAPADA